MNSKELEDGLKIFFDKEETDLQKGNNTFTTEEKREGDNFYKTKLIIDYPNSENLKTLYSHLENKEDKQYFIKRLQKEITDSDEDKDKVEKYQSYLQKPFNGLSKLSFYTLLQLGFTNEALESLFKRKKRCNGLLTILNGIKLENYFTIQQLDEIIPKIDCWDGYPVTKRILLERIKSSRFKKFVQKMKSENIEINQDKKTVSEKISNLGFDTKYNTLLAEIDDFLNDNKHKIIPSAMISCLRTFMGDLIIDTANRIAKYNKEEIPKMPDRQEIGNARSYLKQTLELTDKDDRFINSFIDILHAEGGHAFLSEQEYFRLSRNIAIEISLFVLSKYEKKFKS